jgi:hypothetical protein
VTVPCEHEFLDYGATVTCEECGVEMEYVGDGSSGARDQYVAAEEATGDCYEAALKFASWEIPESERHRYRVVHGHPIGQGAIAGLKHGHAWVERTDDVPDFSKVPDEVRDHFTKMYEQFPEMAVTVIDKSNGKDLELSKSVYYGLGNIDRDECAVYEVHEAMKLAVKHKTWGPWPH